MQVSKESFFDGHKAFMGVKTTDCPLRWGGRAQT